MKLDLAMDTPEWSDDVSPLPHEVDFGRLGFTPFEKTNQIFAVPRHKYIENIYMYNQGSNTWVTLANALTVPSQL